MNEIRFYKGKYKVEVLIKTRGKWTVQALEELKDKAHGEEVEVKPGEQRIVPPNLLFKRKTLLPPLKEHVYELKMEKKLKKLIEEDEIGKKRKPEFRPPFETT